MSVQLLDKTRKINKLLHNSSSSKVVFNDFCQVLMDTLSSNILVLSKKGKVLGVSICPGVDEITELIDVTRADRLEAVQALCEGLSKPVSVVPGGKTRAESVLCGLSAAAMPYAAIHDGARPLVTNEGSAQAVSAAGSCGAAAPAVPVHDTIKRAESGLVLETPDRSTLFAVQTPQVFRTEEIRSVLSWAIAQGLPLTDDS